MAIVPDSAKLDKLREKEPEELTIEEVEKLINDEFRLWNAVGMNPRGIGGDTFVTSIQVVAMAEILVEKGLIDKDELNLIVARNQYKTMRQIREEHQQEALKARLTQGIHGPLPKDIKL